ncbi:MAG: hypothetical protein ABL908_15325 [Hyphomicrobium sp.]
MRKTAICCAIVGVALGGCSRDARLYPSNPLAGSGLLQAKFTDSGMGKGPVQVVMPDGEVLTGEFTTMDTSTYGYGTVFASVGRTSAVASGSSAAISGSMPGVVNAIGTNGTSLKCDYAVNTWTGSGAGVCQTNKGAVYDLQF